MHDMSDRGILISPFSYASEQMAYGMVKSLRRFNADLPVLVLSQGYLCGLPWKGLAKVKAVREYAAHRSDESWMNKLAALSQSPFGETLYLDCDIVMLSDPAWWFDYLATDDFTFFNLHNHPDEIPDGMRYNLVNPHRMRERLGAEYSTIIDGGGHFYYRQTLRGQRLLKGVGQILQEALDQRERSLYHWIAGSGNIPGSDELAASILVAQENVQMPAPLTRPQQAIGVFMPPISTRHKWS